MQITRIKQIKNIGTYRDSSNGRIQLKPFTFIYAANTYGKTTFCDIMRSLKTKMSSLTIKLEFAIICYNLIGVLWNSQNFVLKQG